MKKIIKPVLFIIIFSFSFLAFSHFAVSYNGCYPDPAELVTFAPCPDNGYVIRCNCGSGSCSPSWQEFCDEPWDPM